MFFAAAAAPRPRVCFVCFVLARMQLAPPRRRGVGAAISSSERCRAATDMTVGHGVC